MSIGSKLRAQAMTARATVQRKTEEGWITVASGVFCDVEDRTTVVFDADPVGASTSRVGIWMVAFRTSLDVRQSDRLSVTLRSGVVLPVLTVSHRVLDDYGDALEVIAVAEESAVPPEWVTFYRYDQDANTTETLGTFPVSVAWDAREPRNVDLQGISAVWQTCTLTGEDPFPVYAGDYVAEVQGRRGGTVIEARDPVAGRKEVRARFESGVS